MASQKVLEEKQAIISEIVDSVKESSSVIFFEYRGLSVGNMTELRRNLRNNDSDVRIYKNTLTKRALDNLKINLDDELIGPKAIAFGKDTITPVKILSEFAEKHPALQIKVGIIDGEITGIDTLKKLATIPSREVLLTMLAGGLIGVIRDLSISLDLYSQKLEK